MTLKWRFPASSFGESKGISTGDQETFKKSPYKSFAREVLQNSIDAKLNNDKPVIVEFQEFQIIAKNIPGYKDYRIAIENILSYWKHKKEYVDIYSEILESLNDEDKEICCLRISDYNTTGLCGAFSNDRDKNNFFALTKGTGVSEKDKKVPGGSKGVGKNSAFLLSKYKMVFYSSKTIQNEEASFGVTKLISGYVADDKSEIRDYTQGIGFYSNDKMNSAIHSLMKFDGVEDRTETGTDIYIIGFEKEEDWTKEIINSLLDSFMASIVKNELKVKFNGKIIDSTTLKSTIESDDIFESNKANVYSQYHLLSEADDVRVFDIETEFGTPKLFIWAVPANMDEYASHECAMIRYPFMKIKSFPINKSYCVSALCIIEDDKLGKELRAIENPQHIDWEPKRIKDKNERSKITKIIASIREQINKCVLECLNLSDSNPLDPYGAGNYLPAGEVGAFSGEQPNQTKDITRKISISKKKPVISYENKTSYDSGEDYSGVGPDIGSFIDEDEGSIHPEGHNQNSGGKDNPGNTNGGKSDGEDVVTIQKKLSGIKYKVVAENKNEGKYKIIFSSPEYHNNCYLCISLIDDSNKKYRLPIESLICQGNKITSLDKKEFGPFVVNAGEKTILNIQVNEKEYFASEVTIICK